MNQNSATEVCPSDDIAAYVDGELSEKQRTRLEQHVSACEICSRSLMEQRQFLAALSATLDCDSAPVLPEDFTKKVVMSAENSVSGIRRPGELLTASFISAALIVFAVCALGIESFGFASPIYGLGEKLFAFGLLVFKLIGSLAFAVVVVLRSFAAQFDPLSLMAVAGLVFTSFVIYFSTRRAFRRSAES